MTQGLYLDLSGVIFEDANTWMEAHRIFGTEKQAKKYAHLLKQDYRQLEKRIVEDLWKGKDATEYLNMINNIEYIDGVKEFLEDAKNKDYDINIVTASSYHLAKRINKELGHEYITTIWSNKLEIDKDKKVTGKFISDIKHGGFFKALAIQQDIQHLENRDNFKHEETIFIGDTSNDIEAATYVRQDLGGNAIAFDPKVNEISLYCNVTFRPGGKPNLAKLIKYL